MVRYKIEELDFLFIYEHKVRELENLCLLKYELTAGATERRSFISRMRRRLRRCVPSIIPGS